MIPTSLRFSNPSRILPLPTYPSSTSVSTIEEITANRCIVNNRVTIHIRWSVTLDIWSKRRKERKRIENERMRALGIEVPTSEKRRCCSWGWFRRSQSDRQHETNDSYSQRSPSSPSHEIQHISRNWTRHLAFNEGIRPVLPARVVSQGVPPAQTYARS